MLRKILAVAGSIVFLCGFSLNVARATELEMRPYLYTQNFEEVDPVKFWITNGEYTINFKGLTEEKSFSGRKSFKLDVTFKKGSFFYWYIPTPTRVPAEGRLKFSGHIFLGEETTGSACLGANVQFPPTASGCIFFEHGKKGEWRLIEGDLVKEGKNTANVVMSGHVWAVEAEEIGIYVDRIGLFLFGGEGQRVVLYVDDIRIEGEVPTQEAYSEEIKRRWAPAKVRFEEKISSWEKVLAKSEEEMASLTDLSEEAEKLKREVGERISSTKEKVKTIKGRGFINLSEQKEIDPFLGQQKSIINNIKQVSEGRLKFKDMLIHVIPPISPHKILPFDAFIPGEISDEISVIATPGEYEPASFVVSALSDITILAEATDLKGEKAVIPSQNIDIKIVKCWFQGATAWQDIGAGGDRVLVPELLLNDASLVKVDFERQENYLRLSFPDGERYVWISEPDAKAEASHFKILTIEDYPVKDSPYLLPVHIPARTNKQFWVTVKVPDTAQAGVYTGNITLSTEKETLATLTLKLRILPFKLSSPKTYHNLEREFVSSIYYRGMLHPDYPKGSISSEWKSREQLRAELKNMFAHGITNPTVYQGLDGLGEYLKIREEIGMGGKPLYFLGVNATWSPLATIKEAIEFAKSYGIPEVYFYGADEAKAERLKAQREAWIATRKAGGKIFTAGYVDSNFPLMGDIQDLQVSAGRPLNEEAALWHSVGHRIFCYANPQGGVENPEIYRRNFGLFLWKHNYDGAMTYAYQHSFGNIWNDFDDPIHRDHNFTYPTINGVITTIALAGYREGVDDIRYVTTLRLAIEEAKKSGDRRIREMAASTERYLEELDLDRCLDTIRLEIIGHILRLQSAV